jgi:opacity protein-like surface antigen
MLQQSALYSRVVLWFHWHLGFFMTTRLFAVAVALLMPAVAVAQWDDPPAEPFKPAAPASAPTAAAPAPDSGEPRLRGFELSFALGYAISFGDYFQSDGRGASIADELSGHIPVVVGAGYRINPLISVGAIFQYGYGLVKSDICPGNVSCSATDYRLSIEARFHFLAEQSFSPWVSVGLGYEWLAVEVSASGQSNGETVRGRELVNLEVGGDFRVSPMFTVGPFLGLRVAQFSTMDVDGETVDIPSANKSYHGWIAFGVRGAFIL